MKATLFNTEARFIYEGRSFDAFAFCTIETDLPWLVEVQNVVEFWINGRDNVELLTSGSTGQPKKISLARHVLEQSAKATLNAFDLKEGSDALLFLPCQYVGGKMMVIRALVGGLHLFVDEPKLTFPHLKDNFQFVALTPVQASNSLDQLHRFFAVLLGGGPVPYQLEQQLQKVLAAVYHSYGMTETASHVALRKINGLDSSERYVALPGVTFSQDARQCLIIDAPLWNVHDLITNDIVELIDEHQFTWKGRADNVINSGGVKIFPEEVEKLLEKQIDQPFFVGSLADETFGQKLVLFVEGTLDKSIDFTELPKLWQPKKTVLMANFVYTNTNKINRLKTIEKFSKT